MIPATFLKLVEAWKLWGLCRFRIKFIDGTVHPASLEQLRTKLLPRKHVSSFRQYAPTKGDKMYDFIAWLAGLLTSVVLGHIIVKWANFGLRKYIEVGHSPAKLTPTIGCMERGIYTLATVFQVYGVIAAVFGIKMVERFITYSKIENEEDFKNAAQRINVFMICNVISLGFGMLGGIIISKFITN